MPFEGINSSDSNPQTRFVGFDMDLMREIGKRLNVSVEFTDQPFSGIITAVQTKQFDAGISSFSITPDRQQQIDFSDPYYEIQQAILIRKNDTSINGAGDLH
jgi:polar amino acid transport system substrate-binding protein